MLPPPVDLDYYSVWVSPSPGSKSRSRKLYTEHGFSPHPTPFFSCHRGVPTVAAAGASDATPVPKGQQEPLQGHLVRHLPSQSQLLRMPRPLGRHWAAIGTFTANTKPLDRQCRCVECSGVSSASDQTGIFASSGSLPVLVPPIHRDLGEGFSSWSCPHLLPRLSVEQVHGVRPEDRGGLAAPPCPQQPGSYPHPCTWNPFPWVCSVPGDPLFCHRNRPLAA